MWIKYLEIIQILEENNISVSIVDNKSIFGNSIRKPDEVVLNTDTGTIGMPNFLSSVPPLDIRTTKEKVCNLLKDKGFGIDWSGSFEHLIRIKVYKCG